VSRDVPDVAQLKLKSRLLSGRISELQQQLSCIEHQRNSILAEVLVEFHQHHRAHSQQLEQSEQHGPHSHQVEQPVEHWQPQPQCEQLLWFVKARSNGFRSNPLRLPDRLNSDGVSICRPHNYRSAIAFCSSRKSRYLFSVALRHDALPCDARCGRCHVTCHACLQVSCTRCQVQCSSS
jgi:hypothetical protein